MMEILGSVLMATGAAFSVLAAWGILDFPSPIARMHAATKTASLGLSLLAVGAGVAASSWPLIGVGVLVASFMFVTAPIAGHMLGRAAYLAGQATDLVRDDLASADPLPVDLGRPERKDRRPLRWVALVAVWMLLWREASWGTLAGGAIVATLVEAVRESFAADTSLRLSGLASFLARYLGIVVSTNLRVAWEVITPTNEKIREAIVAVPLHVDTLNAALLVANAVSFTPGTLTIELTEGPLTLYAHVLHFSTVDEVVASVRSLERLAAKVFPSSEESGRQARRRGS